MKVSALVFGGERIESEREQVVGQKREHNKNNVVPRRPRALY